MGEILVLIIMMGMYATGYISGKAIYKDETNDLNRRLASVRKWWQDGIEESKCLNKKYHRRTWNCPTKI